VRGDCPNNVDDAQTIIAVAKLTPLDESGLFIDISSYAPGVPPTGYPSEHIRLTV
jgi:hypothetical protein